MAISPIKVDYNPDLCIDDPHRAGPENLNNLCGQLVVARGPLVGAFVWNPTNLDA